MFMINQLLMNTHYICYNFVGNETSGRTSIGLYFSHQLNPNINWLLLGLAFLYIQGTFQFNLHGMLILHPSTSWTIIVKTASGWTPRWGGSPEQKETWHWSLKEDLLIFYLCFVVKYVKQVFSQQFYWSMLLHVICQGMFHFVCSL